MRSVNDFSKLRPVNHEAPSGLPVYHSLACPDGHGTERSLDRQAPCRVCGVPMVLSSTYKPLPVPEQTPIQTGFANDPVLARLLTKQRALPAEIRALEDQVITSKAQRKAAAEFLGTMRVRQDAGVARQQDVDAAVDAVEAAEIAQREAESALDAAVASRRAIGDLIVKTYEERRAALAPQTTAAARKYLAEITPHLDAIDRLAAKAEADGLRFDVMFGDTSAMGHRTFTHKTGVPIAILRWFAAQHGPRKSALDVIERFREHAKRLSEGA